MQTHAVCHTAQATHSPTFTHCFSYFKFKHILSTLNSCPCTLSPFCQGFYILSNHNRKPHTSNSIIGWSTGESTGVPQKVQIGQTTLADGLFTEVRSPLLCAAEIAGSCPVCFYAQKFNLMDTKFNINWNNASICNHLGLVLDLGLSKNILFGDLLDIRFLHGALAIRVAKPLLDKLDRISSWSM